MRPAAARSSGWLIRFTLQHHDEPENKASWSDRQESNTSDSMTEGDRLQRYKHSLASKSKYKASIYLVQDPTRARPEPV